MEVFEGEKKRDETLSGISTVSQVNEFVKNKEGEENEEVIVNEQKKVLLDLGDDNVDDGMKVNWDVNGTHEGNEEFVGDPMETGLPAEGDKKDEDVMKVFEWEDEMNTNDNGGNVKIREDNAGKLSEKKGEINVEEGDIKEEEEVVEDHGFVVGDFVWGKTKGNTWWPGQIYDPVDASANAAKSKQQGCLLVANFGDTSFSWCSPSQLKPFIDHFTEMSKQSESKKLVTAVQMALEEVSRLVEAELMCKCQTGERVGSGVVNKGIKKGVLVPKGNTITALMDRIEPVDLVLNLQASAIMVPGTGVPELEVALLKSCLNAFYSKKGGYLLARYQDPELIEGLEDETRSGAGVGDDSDYNASSESIDNGDGDDTLYQSRKKKKVVDLLREYEPETKKTKTMTDRGGSGKRKRKSLVVSVSPESDDESGGGGGGFGVEGTISPRQRRKSKYLSPPYLSPVVGGKHSVLGSGSGSGSFKESKVDPEKIPETVEDSLKKCSGKKTHQKKGTPDVSASDHQEEQKTIIDASVNVSKVFKVLLRVALDPTSFTGYNLPSVTDFITCYRNSVFVEGPSYEPDQKKNARDTLDLTFIKQNQGSGCQNNQKKNTGNPSDLVFIEQKLESMMEIVQKCEEGEINADVKASLEGGMQEVLKKIGKMKRK